jgi:hypothetical protein
MRVIMEYDVDLVKVETDVSGNNCSKCVFGVSSFHCLRRTKAVCNYGFGGYYIQNSIKELKEVLE